MRKITMKRKSRVSEINSSESAESVNENDERLEDNSEDDENLGKKSRKKGGKKPRKSEGKEANGTEDSANDDNYEVEAILEQKSIRGVKHYLIRWKGYGADSDTWEPESTVDCPDLIAKFQGKIASPDSAKNSPKKAKKRASTQGGNKTKKPKSDSSGQDSGEGEFEVDRIIEVHHKKNGQREFLVHWKGYSSNENTWEPEENMNCQDLIDKFMEKVNRARESDTRELRVNRKPTKRFTLTMVQSGRRVSRRNLGKQRAQYKDSE